MKRQQQLVTTSLFLLGSIAFFYAGNGFAQIKTPTLKKPAVKAPAAPAAPQAPSVAIPAAPSTDAITDKANAKMDSVQTPEVKLPKLQVRAGATYAMVNPTALNDALTKSNSATVAGTTSTPYTAVKSMMGGTATVGYHLNSFLEFAPYFTWLTKSTESTISVATPKLDASSKVTLQTMDYGLLIPVHFYNHSMFRLWAGPGIGMSRYSVQSKMTMSGAATSDLSITATHSGLSYQGALGTDLYFSDSLGGFLMGAYQMKKAGTMVITSASSSPGAVPDSMAVGKNLKMGGSDASIDLSGFAVTAGLTFAM